MPSSFPPSLVHIRDTRPEDAIHVAKLGSHVYSLTFGHSLPPEHLQTYLNESYSVAAITEDITSPMKDMILATTKDDVIAGFALLTRGTSEPCVAHLEKAIELQRLYVHPDYHGKGVGRVLADNLERIARDQGFKNMWLGVWEENFIAQKLYTKLGYKTIGDHPFTMGEIVQTDLIMAKEL